jgi:hypothetical protein
MLNQKVKIKHHGDQKKKTKNLSKRGQMVILNSQNLIHRVLLKDHQINNKTQVISRNSQKMKQYLLLQTHYSWLMIKLNNLLD